MAQTNERDARAARERSGCRAGGGPSEGAGRPSGGGGSFRAGRGPCYPSGVTPVEQTLHDYFASRRSRVVAAYLFGSEARGESSSRSDVDVGIVVEEGAPRTLSDLSFDLAGDLEELLGRPVDLVHLNGADPDLIHRVLREGVLVHEGDRSRRIAFEVRARNDYFDMLPFRRRYRRAGAHSA